MDSRSKVKGQHPVWKATNVNEDYKNRCPWYAEPHAVFLAVTEEWKNVKSPSVWVFTDSQAVANSPAIWSGKRIMGSWPIKGMSLWGTVLWK